MADMGKYCKAYQVKRLREFPSWSENTGNLRPNRSTVDGVEVEEVRTTLDDDDILYVQENYAVTDGVFKDEHVVFDRVDDAWKAFCEEQLAFQIPDYATSSGEEGAADE